MKIKILILIIIFCIMYWFQYIDDIKNNKERLFLYDKIKLPLLITTIICLIFFFDYNKCTTLENDIAAHLPIYTGSFNYE